MKCKECGIKLMPFEEDICCDCEVKQLAWKRKEKK